MTPREQQRWIANLDGVRLYAERNGTPMAPAGTVIRTRKGEINVGGFVAYVRSRYRLGRLDKQRIRDLEKIPGWTWAPLPPGPRGEVSRNEEIRKLRRSGVTLAELAEQFGMSRQRIHQIAPDAPDPRKHAAHLAARRLERLEDRETARAREAARRSRKGRK